MQSSLMRAQGEQLWAQLLLGCSFRNSFLFPYNGKSHQGFHTTASFVPILSP